MAEPRRDPETGGRSLAEILREAGIESPARGRRRRWDDPDDTGIRQRRAEAEAKAEAEAEAEAANIAGRPYGRRASDLRVAAGTPGREARPVAAPPGREPRPADPSTAAIPGMRPSGKPDVPGADAGLVRERRPDERRDDRRLPDRRPDDRRPDDRRMTDRRVEERRLADRRVEERRPEERRPADRRADKPVGEERRPEERRPEERRQEERRIEERRQADRRTEERKPVEPRPDRRAGDRRASAAPPVEEHRRERVPAPARPLDDNPVTGPIPIVAEDLEAEDLDSTPKESALAWLRFGGELIIALAAGVGIYFLFTVIWEMLPHLAVLVAPLAVTGLVAGVSAYRQKMSRDPVGPKLLAVLVFAGTLLTVAPAAGLLASG